MNKECQTPDTKYLVCVIALHKCDKICDKCFNLSQICVTPIYSTYCMFTFIWKQVNMYALVLTIVDVEWEGLQCVSIVFACSVAQRCGNSVENIQEETENNHGQ